MKRSILTAIVLLVVLMFMGTSFLIAVDHYHNSSPTSATVISHLKFGPSVQSSTKSSSGYVKYTLDLINNSLINGNFVNTSNSLYPYGVAFDSSNGYVYVTSPNSGNVLVINSSNNQVITSLRDYNCPHEAAFDPSNGNVYVTNYCDFTSNCPNYVTVINGSTNKLIATIGAGSEPHGVAIDTSNGNVYVANYGSDNVSVINGSTNKVIANITVGFSPRDAAFDPSNGNVYVSNYGSDNVSVINGSTNKVIANISVGSEPYGVAFDSSNGYLYVIDVNFETVSVINVSTNNVIANISVGLFSKGAAFDSSNGNVYVANSFSGTVSIISSFTPTQKLYGMTFTETGLTSKTTWYVNLSNGMDSGPITTASYTFSLANGSYSYTVTTSDKTSQPSPSSGSFTVNGSPLSKSVKFSQVYELTFTETGLLSGTPWYVNLTNGMVSGAITDTSYSLLLTNGSYSYKVSTSDKKYSPSPSSGSFTVNGASVSKSVTFAKVTYTLTFTESGLPSGTTWYVNLSNGQTYSSTTGTLSFTEPNGTYSYTAATTDKLYSAPGGTFTVNGQSQSLSVAFHKNLFSQEFIEHGLPSGTLWSATVDQTQYLSTSNCICVELPNGSYNAQFSSPSGYFPTPSQYMFTVDGSSQSFDIVYGQARNETFIKPLETILPAQQIAMPGSIVNASIYSLSLGFAFDNSTGLLFIPLISGSNSGLYVYNVLTGKFLKTINDPYVYDAVYNPSTGFVYAISLSGNLSEINPSTFEIVKNVSVPSANDAGVFLDQQGTYIYAYNLNTGSITQIDVSSMVLTKTLAVGPTNDISPLYTVIGGYAYFANTTGNEMIILNLSTGAVKTIILPKDYTAESVLPYLGSDLLIGGENYSDLIYNVSSSAITLGPQISGIASSVAYDSISHSLYIASMPTMGNFVGNITEVNPEKNTIIATIPGTIAFAIVFDPSTQEVITDNYDLGSVSLYSVQHYYTVTFTESGLPSGTSWYVNLSNVQTYSSTTGTLSFTEPNYTYSYTITTSYRALHPSPSSGSFTVNGAPLSESVTFSNLTYSVTFSETGLPSGVEWYINGSALSGHAISPSSISFTLTNGTYVFTVTNLSSYYTTTYSFTITVAGKNVTETVNYHHYAYITGTISPSNASLTINGKSVNISSTGAFNVSVANGTYHVVASLSGYNSYYNNFTLNSRNVKNLTITLKPLSNPSTISATEIYIIIIGAVVAIVVAIIGIVMFVRRR